MWFEWSQTDVFVKYFIIVELSFIILPGTSYLEPSPCVNKQVTTGDDTSRHMLSRDVTLPHVTTRDNMFYAKGKLLKRIFSAGSCLHLKHCSFQFTAHVCTRHGDWGHVTHLISIYLSIYSEYILMHWIYFDILSKQNVSIVTGPGSHGYGCSTHVRNTAAQHWMLLCGMSTAAEWRTADCGYRL